MLSSEAQARARVAELERQNHEVEQSFAAHEYRLAQNEVATYHDLERLGEEKSQLGEPSAAQRLRGRLDQLHSGRQAWPAFCYALVSEGICPRCVRPALAK